MEKKIVISADIKAVKASLQELDKLVKNTLNSTQKIKIFDEKDTDLFKKWATDQIPRVQKEIEALKDKLKGLADQSLLEATKKELEGLQIRMSDMGATDIMQKSNEKVKELENTIAELSDINLFLKTKEGIADLEKQLSKLEKIKIGEIDSEEAQKTIESLDTLFRGLSKKEKIKIFDKTEKEVLKNWAKTQIPAIKKELDELKKTMKETAEVDLLIKTKKEVDTLEKKLKRLENIKIGKLEQPEEKKGFLETLQGLPGIGGLMKPGPLIALAAATKLISRGKEAYNQRMSEVPERYRMAGIAGMDRYKEFTKAGGPYQGVALGYGPTETLQQANQLLRATGSTEQLSKIQRVSRAFGMESDETIGQMGMLRKVGGQENVDKNYAKILASAIVSGLDQSMIAEYLSNVSDFTGQIAQDGIPDIPEVSKAISSLVKQGGILGDTQRTTRALGNLQSQIQNAQGGKFGFFASAFEKLLGNQTTGAQKMFAMQQGMFGVDTKRLTSLSKKDREDLQLGGKLSFKSVTDNIVKQFDRATKGLDVFGKSMLASNITGVKNPAEALNLIESLRKGEIGQQEFEKKIKESEMSPESKLLEDIKKELVDARVAATTAKNEMNLSKLGDQIVPSINEVKNTLLDIEAQTLIPLAQDIRKVLEPLVKGVAGGVSSAAEATGGIAKTGIEVAGGAYLMNKIGKAIFSKGTSKAGEVATGKAGDTLAKQTPKALGRGIMGGLGIAASIATGVLYPSSTVDQEEENRQIEESKKRYYHPSLTPNNSITALQPPKDIMTPLSTIPNVNKQEMPNIPSKITADLPKDSFSSVVESNERLSRNIQTLSTVIEKTGQQQNFRTPREQLQMNRSNHATRRQ